MENIIAFNEFLGTVRIPISIDGSNLVLTGHTIAGFLIIVFASYCRFLAVSGWGSWEKANEQVEPSLQHSPPPIFTTRQGCLGLMTSVITRPIYALSVLLGVDQIFMAGGFSLTILRVILT